MAYRLGVDVGGTFTDLLLVHDETGGLHRVKTPSTPIDPSQSFADGIALALDRGAADPSAVERVLHGTTIATNLIVEGKGAPTALLTTGGFR